MTDALAHYRFADAARTLYDFAWNEFCSFYVEMTKARFHVDESLRDSNSGLRHGESSIGETRPRDRQTAQRVLAHALDVLMRLLHPMMPFLTEEVWQLLGGVAPERGLASRAVPAPAARHKGFPACHSRKCLRRRVARMCQRAFGRHDRRAIRGFSGGARRRARSAAAAERPLQGRTYLHRAMRCGDRETARTDAALFRPNGARKRDPHRTDGRAAGRGGQLSTELAGKDRLTSMWM